MTQAERELFLEELLEIGGRMVQCGAEVRRAENTIDRIVGAYGLTAPCVYATTTIIEASVKFPDGAHYTQARRLEEGGTDLGQLERLNALARKICADTPTVQEIGALLRKCSQTRSNGYVDCLGYILAAIGFAVFFGGSLLDGLASGVIAIGIYLMDRFLQLRNQNKIIYTGMASLVSGSLAMLFVAVGFGSHADSVMIGDIMLFIPALPIINGVREMFYRDVLTGLYRLVSAVLTAVAIAAGFGAAIVLFGGLV